MQWYISVAAVHEYQRIAGYPEDADGPAFDRAAKELDEICQSARMSKDEGHRQIWIAKASIHGKMERLELYVSLQQRKEGPLNQLVRVRSKGRNKNVR